jgi:hypothetical protein
VESDVNGRQGGVGEQLKGEAHGGGGVASVDHDCVSDRFDHLCAMLGCQSRRPVHQGERRIGRGLVAFELGQPRIARNVGEHERVGFHDHLT